MGGEPVAASVRDRSQSPRSTQWLAIAFTVAMFTAAAESAALDPPPSGSESCEYSGRAEIVLPVPQPGDTLALSHRIIAADTFTLSQDSTLFVAGRDYRLIAIGGEVQWLAGSPAGHGPLIARYRYLPLPISGRYGGPAAEAWPDTLALQPPVERAGMDLPAGAQLEIGGSKTVSVDFGNRRDVGLSQSLDLSIQGQLAQNVRVQAILTDRSTPLQPEGTTAELSDLDQVLVSIDSPWGALRLGDIGVAQREIGFLSHQREMEGLLAQAKVRGGYGGHAAVGRGVGDHRTLERFGEDAKQGPYLLLAQRPGDESVVIAGSERVWLDGQRLQRGEDADYVIDYGTAELWFTARRPISAVSEIRVDYQARQGAFDREYYSLSGAAGDSTGGLTIGWLRERDNPDQSPLIALGDDELRALHDAGDSTTAALSGGVVPVAPGEGDYILAEADTLEQPFFVYVGRADPLDPSRPGGSYLVTFADVGEGRGDYADTTNTSGDRFFMFIGPRQGRYLPGRSVPLPASLDVVGLRTGGKLPGELRVNAEAAVSKNDRNILSSRNDSDNDGHAISAEGEWPLGATLGSRADLLALRFHWRDVGTSFVSPEPLDPAFTYRRWNASSAAVLDGHDNRGGLGLSFRPLESVQLAGDWERLRAGDRFSGDRWELRAERRGTVSASGQISRANSNERGEARDANRERAELGWNGPAVLKTSYEMEELLNGATGHEDGTGHRAAALSAALPHLFAGLRAALVLQTRWDRTWHDGASRPDARRRLQQAEVAYEHGPWTTQVLAAHSVTDQTVSQPERTSDLLDWVLAHADGQRGVLTGEWRGRVTTAEERLRQGELLAVASGSGHYDSLGNYVGLGGDHEFHFVRSDSSALETRLESALRVTARPFASASNRHGALRGLEETFYAKLEAATPETMGELAGDLSGLLQGDDAFRLHDRLLRSDLSWSGAVQVPAPRLRLESSDRKERPASGFGRHQQRDVEELEIRWAVRDGFTIRSQAALEREREGVLLVDSGMEDADEVRARRGLLELSGRIVRPFGWRAGTELRRESLEPQASTRHLVKAVSALSAEFTRGGRVELAFERIWADADAENMPFLLDESGSRLTLTGSLRPQSGITASVNLGVDKRDGHSTVTNGRMEVRAFF